MNNLKKRYDNYVGEAPRFTVSLEDRILNEVTSLRKKQKKRIVFNHIRLSFLFAVVITVATVFVMSIATNPTPDNLAAKVIKDELTQPMIEFVEPSENTFIIEYGYDNMDRGNHDFLSIDGERPTVIEKMKEDNFKRGDIIYYKYPGDSVSYNPPDYYLSRIVGLPGETVEIIDGQVFINKQKLDTFYSEARRLGQNMDEWFEPDGPESSMEIINSKKIEDFKEDMKEIKIPNDSVFVLSDDWFRGTDSRYFGPLKISAVEGKVLGYLKEK